MPIAKAYSAVSSSKRGKMRIRAVEAPDHNVANDAFNAMNSMLGGPSGNEGHGSGNIGNIGETIRKNKPEIYLALFIIAIIAITAFLYVQTQWKNPYGIFPEKLGDMNISLYRDGDTAMTEVKKLHRGTKQVCLAIQRL